MPAGVPSAGVTMDERIRNLMRERGHEHLFMSVDDPDLADQNRRRRSAPSMSRRKKFATPWGAPSRATCK